MIILLMLLYSIFILIGVRKNKKNEKEYKKMKCLSIIVLGIVNSILILHDNQDESFIFYLKQYGNFENWTGIKECIFFISIASSLIALLIYVNDIDGHRN